MRRILIGRSSGLGYEVLYAHGPAESEQNCSLQSATPQRGRHRGEALVGCAPSADLMLMWPISTRVNKPENDDPSILDRRAADET
jgi:hypothetical protein